MMDSLERQGECWSVSKDGEHDGRHDLRFELRGCHVAWTCLLLLITHHQRRQLAMFAQLAALALLLPALVQAGTFDKPVIALNPKEFNKVMKDDVSSPSPPSAYMPARY